MMFNFTFKAELLRWRGYAFLAGADHGRYEKEKWTRRQSPYVPPWSYTVSGLRWFRIDEKKRRL